MSFKKRDRPDGHPQPTTTGTPSRTFNRDAVKKFLATSHYTWDKQQFEYLIALMSPGNIFLTGGAGTGKSTLLKYGIKCLRQNGQLLKESLSAYRQNPLLDLQSDLDALADAAGKDGVRDDETQSIIDAADGTTRDEGWLAITGTTGNAATLIHGMTLHSFAGIGLEGELFYDYIKLHPEEADLTLIPKRKPADRDRGGNTANKKKKTYGDRRNNLTQAKPKTKSVQYRWIKEQIKWRRLCCLLIDEVSMLNPQYLGALDRCARVMRKIDKPFGGIQIIVCGDFFQLPPVIKEVWDSKSKLNRAFQNSSNTFYARQTQSIGEQLKYAFQHAVWKESSFRNIILEVSYRQHGDMRYVELLNRARIGELNTDDIVMILSTSLEKMEISNQTTNAGGFGMSAPQKVTVAQSSGFGQDIADEHSQNPPQNTNGEDDDKETERNNLRFGNENSHLSVSAMQLFYERRDMRIANELALLRLDRKILTFRGTYVVGPFTKVGIAQDLIFNFRNYSDHWTTMLDVPKMNNSSKTPEDLSKPRQMTRLSSGMISILAEVDLLEQLSRPANPNTVDYYVQKLIYADWKAESKQKAATDYTTLRQRCMFIQSQHDVNQAHPDQHYPHQQQPQRPQEEDEDILPPLSIFNNPLQSYGFPISPYDGRPNIPPKAPSVKELNPKQKRMRLENAADFEWPSLIMHKAVQFSPDFFTLLCSTEDLPHPPLIHLCVGSQVVLTKNLDVKAGLVNGSRGVIIGFQPVARTTNASIEHMWPCVKFELIHPSSGKKHHDIRVIIPHVYEVPVITKKMKIKYPPSYVLPPRAAHIPRSYCSNTSVFYQQIPLELASCRTYHGSQGTTIHGPVLLDLSKKYSYGLGYTGLSRVSSIKNVQIVSTFNKESIRADPLVVEFYANMAKEMNQLKISQQNHIALQ
jgi:hypothetical protein